MRIHLIHGGSRLRLGALAALATVAIAGPALAAVTAKPEKGKTYSGSIRRTSTVKIPITFKVSENGKSVSHFTMTPKYPTNCSGGGFPTMKSRSARISRKGTFTAKLPLVSTLPPPRKRDGTVTVTGRFGRGGKESGKVKTVVTSSKSCDGRWFYSTKAG